MLTSVIRYIYSWYYRMYTYTNQRKSAVQLTIRELSQASVVLTQACPKHYIIVQAMAPKNYQNVLLLKQSYMHV